jgi:hypothetical protein
VDGWLRFRYLVFCASVDGRSQIPTWEADQAHSSQPAAAGCGLAPFTARPEQIGAAHCARSRARAGVTKVDAWCIICARP